jgi:hypothetical protein
LEVGGVAEGSKALFSRMVFFTTLMFLVNLLAISFVATPSRNQAKSWFSRQCPTVCLLACLKNGPKTSGRSANFDTLQHTEFLQESADFNCAVCRGNDDKNVCQQKV